MPEVTRQGRSLVFDRSLCTTMSKRPREEYGEFASGQGREGSPRLNLGPIASTILTPTLEETLVFEYLDPLDRLLIGLSSKSSVKFLKLLMKRKDKESSRAENQLKFTLEDLSRDLGRRGVFRLLEFFIRYRWNIRNIKVLESAIQYGNSEFLSNFQIGSPLFTFTLERYYFTERIPLNRVSFLLGESGSLELLKDLTERRFLAVDYPNLLKGACYGGKIELISYGMAFVPNLGEIIRGMVRMAIEGCRFGVLYWMFYYGVITPDIDLGNIPSQTSERNPFAFKAAHLIVTNPQSGSPLLENRDYLGLIKTLQTVGYSNLSSDEDVIRRLREVSATDALAYLNRS